MEWLALCLLLLAYSGTPGLGSTVDELHDRLMKLQQTLDTLMRQAMLQQLFIEEKTRRDGDSGVDQVPELVGGTRPYHATSHFTQSNPGPIHGVDRRPNMLKTEGFDAVLNGVKFKKHAEHIWLNKPHSSSKSLGAKELVETPKVPPAVLEKKTVDEQIAEMAEWFKAFKASAYKVRDFRPYFRPLLCYLEGYWERMAPPKGKYFDNGHKLEMSRYHFETMMGRLQAYNVFRGFHPSTVFDFSGNEPRFAKFKTRTLCAPLKKYIFPNRFRAVDELSSRVPTFRRYIDHINHSNARFTINRVDSSNWSERLYRNGFLDELMAEIPGLDNYAGAQTDNAFDLPVYPNINSESKLNTAFYHRYYKVRRNGAMGLQVRHRSYSDSSIFMAQNSQASVPAMSVEDCKYVSRKRVCKTYVQRWSYAIPLAVVYQTPLQAWNPYNLQEHKFGDRSVTANGRNGGLTAAKAFNGTSPHDCPTLPSQFVPGRQYGVLDKTGKVIKVSGCGIRTVLNLKGVGPVRQLYPIFPIYAEGAAENKEMEALKDIVMQSSTKLHFLRGG